MVWAPPLAPCLQAIRVWPLRPWRCHTRLVPILCLAQLLPARLPHPTQTVLQCPRLRLATCTLALQLPHPLLQSPATARWPRCEPPPHLSAPQAAGASGPLPGRPRIDPCSPGDDLCPRLCRCRSLGVQGPRQPPDLGLQRLRPRLPLRALRLHTPLRAIDGGER